MSSRQHKTVILDVNEINGVFQAEVKARLWTVIFAPCKSYSAAITSANNFIRTYGLVIANRKKVSKHFYNIKRI